VIAVILVTNDDGIHSIGLRFLYDAVKELDEVYVVAPESPRSATGLSLTLHKPLRIYKVNLYGEKFYSVSGTPSDVIHLAITKILPRKPDIVLSGINLGDNTSIQVILSSGTCGAAIQASLLGIRALAFSTVIDDPEDFTPAYVEKMKRIIEIMVKHVFEKGFPRGVDVLNINFPRSLEKVKTRITRPARIRFKEAVEERIDPRGKKYYWIHGDTVENVEKDTDIYAVFVENAISITPIALNLYPIVGFDWVQNLRDLERKIFELF